MILAHLILAHLLGDFVFQPSSLVLWKMKNYKGTLVHVLIHFIVSSLVLLPYLINGYLWLIWIILAVCLAHFFIDLAKISYDLRHDKKVRPFVIDQLLHFLTLLVAYFFLSEITFVFPETDFYSLYNSINVILFAIVLVFLSTTIEVYRFQRAREKYKNPKLKLDTKSILFRIGVFTIIYAFFVLMAYFAAF